MRWHAGAGNSWPLNKMVLHVRHPKSICPPPHLSRLPPQPLPAELLWASLKPKQHKALVLLLSALLARRLQASPPTEVANDPL